MSLSRRHFMGLTPVAFSPLSLAFDAAAAHAQAPESTEPPRLPLPDAFPSHSLPLSREMVIAAHGNLPRVKALLSRWPTLAKAAIDWGYGDWEDALGAASHTGRREIADLLIANGARPTLFSAAMLGQLDVVSAMIAASPGVERVHGAHSITLLRHAMAGGAVAQPVVEYLKTLPGADARPTPVPITEADLKSLVGTYTFGPDAGDKLVVELNGSDLSIARSGRFARGLTHLGDHAFCPMGATQVRIRFGERNSKPTVAVFDPELVVTADRV
jgi:hypothetical protein